MMMQGQGTVKTSWQAVDEWCICVRIVAMWSGSIREGFRGYVSNLGIECTLLWWQPLPSFNSPKATYGGLWGLCTSIMLFIVGVRYKKMRQTSHKESSGPVAIMLFTLGVRQSSINMVFSSLSEVFSLEVVWVYHLKIRSNLVIGSWPLLCVGR